MRREACYLDHGETIVAQQVWTWRIFLDEYAKALI